MVQNPKELYKYIKDLYKNKSTHYMNPMNRTSHIYQKEKGPEFMSQMKELKARKNLN